MTKNFVIIIVLATIFEQSWTKNENFTEKETECFAQEKVYYEGSGTCEELLKKGNCKRGQWFVLEKPGEISENENPKIRGICANLKCEVNEYYWPLDQSCVKTGDKARLCGPSPDEELKHNLFGEGDCQCKTNPPRARLNADKNNPCHILYTRGPCSQGRILVIDEEDNDTEKAICVADPCYDETRYRRRLGTLNQTSYLAAWENGTCYPLGERGPCPENYIFQVHTSYLKPTCVLLTNTIFNLEKPQDCYQDENGDCQKRINANKYQNAEKYKIELFNSVSAARKRRTIRTKNRDSNKKAEMTWFGAHYH